MITIIASIGKNNELGKDNRLIWHLPRDLKRFKKITTGHCIIMGRKTYESIGKPLIDRTNIIITSNLNYRIDNCISVNSLGDALEASKNDENRFVIGGAEVYKEAIEIADIMDICQVDSAFDADCFFPKIDKTIWKEVNRESFPSDDENPYDCEFVNYLRR